MILFVFYFSYLLQIAFWFVFFGKFVFFSKKTQAKAYDTENKDLECRIDFSFSLFETQADAYATESGVSVVIAARNELENLQKLLPKLLSQNYSLFEIVIVDDRSTDETAVFLEKMQQENPHLHCIRILEKPEKISGKKNALSAGIQKAKYDLLLLTDADCLPSSENWIKRMMNPFFDTKIDIVLGYSPYEVRNSWLNYMIQFETWLTLMQYFSAYIWKIPYMGVGRNLAYRKSVFLEKKGFEKHQEWAGGDDDLLMNEASHFGNTAIVWDEQAHCISKPSLSYKAWLKQKIRHLSVGTQYKMRDRVWIGTFVLSYSLFWFSVLFVLSLPNCLPNVLFCVLTRWFLVGLVFKKWIEKLHSTEQKNRRNILFFLFFLDFLYIFHYIFIGLVSLFSGKTIKWKN